jgi:hypothetical protein
MNTKNVGPGYRAGPVPGPGPLVVGNEGHHGRRRAAPFGPDESRLRRVFPASRAREREREREKECQVARAIVCRGNYERMNRVYISYTWNVLIIYARLIYVMSRHRVSFNCSFSRVLILIVI